MIHINNVYASCENTSIIKNLSLSITPGQLIALMGPNGSGKSTLAQVIMGNPLYTITQGTITFDDVDITLLSPDKRAQKGIFLAFQHPIELPGVAVHVLLKEAYQAIHKTTLSVQEFTAKLHAACDLLNMDYAYLYRNVNEGFSGGEKKRLELLQLIILEPRIAILDEIDSGLDIAGMQLVQNVLIYLRAKNPHMICLVITHNPRLINYIQPDYIYVLCEGTIVDRGDQSIVTAIESKGYHEFQS